MAIYYELEFLASGHTVTIQMSKSDAIAYLNDNGMKRVHGHPTDDRILLVEAPDWLVASTLAGQAFEKCRMAKAFAVREERDLGAVVWLLSAHLTGVRGTVVTHDGDMDDRRDPSYPRHKFWLFK